MTRRFVTMVCLIAFSAYAAYAQESKAPAHKNPAKKATTEKAAEKKPAEKAPAEQAPAEKAASQTDTLEKVEKELLDKWATVNSFSAAFTPTIDIKSPINDNIMHLAGPGSIEYRKLGDLAQIRADLALGVPEMGTTMGRAAIVSDGTSMHAITEIFGKQQVHTIDIPRQLELPSGRLPADGKPAIDAFHQFFNVSLGAPDPNVPDAYVIDGALKSPIEKFALATVRFYFNKESGGLIQVLALDPSGRPMIVIKPTNIQLNPPLGDDRFVFTPPPPEPTPEPAATPASADKDAATDRKAPAAKSESAAKPASEPAKPAEAPAQKQAPSATATPPATAK